MVIVFENSRDCEKGKVFSFQTKKNKKFGEKNQMLWQIIYILVESIALDSKFFPRYRKLDFC